MIDEGAKILSMLSRGELSENEVYNVLMTLEDYGINFDVPNELSKIYKELVFQPGDIQEWVDDSDMVYELLVEQLNTAFNSIDNLDNLIEVDEDLMSAITILERINFL